MLSMGNTDNCPESTRCAKAATARGFATTTGGSRIPTAGDRATREPLRWLHTTRERLSFHS
jgi:hypothetical protein